MIIGDHDGLLGLDGVHETDLADPSCVFILLIF